MGLANNGQLDIIKQYVLSESSHVAIIIIGLILFMIVMLIFGILFIS